MPTYLFRCPKCLSERESPRREPPRCRRCRREMVRVYTPPAISFKGSGFYSTDYS